MATAVTEQSFEEEVLKSDKPVIVDFWAEWCGPCHAVAPVLDRIVDEIESLLHDSEERELATSRVGAIVMERLRELDKVAYVRFASVYRHFRDIGEFMNELKDLLNTRD